MTWFYWGITLVFALILLFWIVASKKSKQNNSQNTLPTLVQGTEAGAVVIAAEKLPMTKLFFGRPENPSLEISAFLDNDDYALVPLDLPESKLSTFSGVFEHVPAIATNAMTATSNLYQLVLSPQTTQALTDGSLTLMKSMEGGIRAAAVDGTGKIVEQGSLFPTDGLESIASAAAIWQVASMIVAQKHLADISEKLSKISDTLVELKQYFEHERLGKLQGSLKYMEDVASVLDCGDLHDDELHQYRHKLEDIEHETLQIIEAVNRDIFARADKIQKFESKDTFGTEKTFNELKSQIHEFDKEQKTWFLSMYVRAAACQLTAALPGGEKMAIHRYRKIQESLRNADFSSSIPATFDAAIDKNLSSVFNKKSTIDGRKTDLWLQLHGTKEYSKDRQSLITHSLENIMSGIEATSRDRENGLQLIGELNASGKLVRLSRAVRAPSV